MDHKSGSARHMLIMLACCLIPLALLGAVLFLKVDLGSFGPVAIMLLCPLLHVFMMRGMGHGHGEAKQGSEPCHEGGPRQANDTKTVVQMGS